MAKFVAGAVLVAWAWLPWICRAQEAAGIPPPGLADARKLLESGEYERALEMFLMLADLPDAPEAPRAAVGAVECLEALGRYEEGLALCERVLAQTPDHSAARYWLGWLQETTGQKAKAIETYRWFEERARSDQRSEGPEVLTYTARGLIRYHTLRGRFPQAVADLILKQLLQQVYDTIDPQYWPARIVAADLLRSKYNEREAREDYLAALRIHPNAADAEVGLALLALEDWNWEEVENRVARALRKNPRQANAFVARAMALMAQRRDEEALVELDKALAINPNHLSALSLAAAVHTRLRNAAASAFIARVEAINPEYGLLHATIGDWLAARRQFREAEGYYLRAIELSPERADPRTSLGRMYMEMGETAKARLTLDAAFRIDPFNVRTFNTLNLLDELEKFAVVETRNFVLKFDDQKDRILADYFTEYLESIHGELTEKFGFSPTEKTIVEVFPSHDRFAVRVTAMPWLMTVGACTGRVIALDAPRRDARLTPFDWKDVLRHEFVHVITLGQTENRIAHWFTEGLATREQPLPLDWPMRQGIVQAVRLGELFPISKLDWGFIRPRRPLDRMLAYAQATMVCDYITEKFGHPKILEMLAGYRDAKTQAQIFREVLGQTEAEFDTVFADWAKQQIESWGFRADPLRPTARIRRDLESAPADPALLGELAEVLAQENKWDEAQRAAAKSLERDPKNARALTVQSLALVQAQKWEEAGPLLERLQAADDKSLVAARLLGQMALRKNQLDEAVKQFRLLSQLCPFDPEGQKGLAETFRRQGKFEEELTPLLALEAGNSRDLELPQRIAAIQRRLGNLNGAIAALEQAMRLDPYDLTIHQRLAALYLEARNYPAALRELRVNCELQPTQSEHFTRLAAAYRRAGDWPHALEAARKAVALDPDSPAARQLLETLEKEAARDSSSH